MTRRPIVSASPAMAELLATIERVAARDCSVLVVAETGCGKELIAREVHARSPRCSGPFVAVNCAAIPRELQVSLFLGAEKGSYTSSTAMQRGYFEQANDGTLFLDELAELAPDAQAVTLRAIEERAIRRVAGTREIPVNVRLIAATNGNLRAAMRAGRFRPDLYYRLAVVELEIPPLRDRPEDIPPLVEHFLALFAPTRSAADSLTPRAWQALLAYDFPGNVRELRNIVERAVALSDGRPIDVADLRLPPPVPPATFDAPPAVIAEAHPARMRRKSGPKEKKLNITVAEAFARLVAREDRIAVASAMGCSPATMYRRIQAWRRAFQ